MALITTKILTNDGKLQPWVFQVAGLILLFAFAGFWMATDRKEPELLIAATGLYAYGQAGKGDPND